MNPHAQKAAAEIVDGIGIGEEYVDDISETIESAILTDRAELEARLLELVERWKREGVDAEEASKTALSEGLQSFALQMKSIGRLKCANELEGALKQ